MWPTTLTFSRFATTSPAVGAGWGSSTSDSPLPVRRTVSGDPASLEQPARTRAQQSAVAQKILHGHQKARPPKCGWRRSEEHTSELQSRGHIVCRLLLAKK